ncbi:hypothetical protein H1R20_g8258, partial [Candolleomyces eurysporus]
MATQLPNFFLPATIMADALLQEVKAEPLLNLLTSIASESAPLGPTHIRALDAFCFSTGSNPSPESPLRLGDVLEIQGPPASGKTHLVYYLLVTCVMPSHHLSLPVQGWGKAAIVFDTDGSFDIRRFKHILSQRLQKIIPSDQVPGVVEQSLRRLAIIKVASTLQLAVSILNVPGYLARLFPRHELGMLVVDSVSTFYWSDRFAAERPASAASSSSSPPSSNRFRHVVTALQRVQCSLSPVIVLSNWGLTPTQKSAASIYYRQHLSPFPDPFSQDAGNPALSTLPISYQITTSRPTPLDGRQRFVGHLRRPGKEMTGQVEFTIDEEGIGFG